MKQFKDVARINSGAWEKLTHYKKNRGHGHNADARDPQLQKPKVHAMQDRRELKIQKRHGHIKLQEAHREQRRGLLLRRGFGGARNKAR